MSVLCINHHHHQPDLSRRLLEVRGHLHTALIQQTQLTEEQGQLTQVFLQLPEAVLIGRLTLRHAVGKLERENALHQTHVNIENNIKNIDFIPNVWHLLFLTFDHFHTSLTVNIKWEMFSSWYGHVTSNLTWSIDYWGIIFCRAERYR